MSEKDKVCFLDDDAESAEKLELQKMVALEEKRAILFHPHANANVELIPDGDYWGWQF